VSTLLSSDAMISWSAISGLTSCSTPTFSTLIWPRPLTLGVSFIGLSIRAARSSGEGDFHPTVALRAGGRTTALGGGHARRLDGVSRGDTEGRFLAKRLRTSEVGVALSMTGVRGLFGVRIVSSYGLTRGDREMDDRSKMVLRDRERAPVP
jgi:hypothetical protein